jgi:hypothetical protein
MDFQHIKDAVCRHCGALAKGDSMEYDEAGLAYVEYRSFRCGAHSEWRAFRNKTFDCIECPQSPEGIATTTRAWLYRLDEHIDDSNGLSRKAADALRRVIKKFAPPEDDED